MWAAYIQHLKYIHKFYDQIWSQSLSISFDWFGLHNVMIKYFYEGIRSRIMCHTLNANVLVRYLYIFKLFFKLSREEFQTFCEQFKFRFFCDIFLINQTHLWIKLVIIFFFTIHSCLHIYDRNECNIFILNAFWSFTFWIVSRQLKESYFVILL